MSVYFAYLDDLVVGPYSLQELRLFLQNGRVTEDTPVNRHGEDGWVRLGELPGLAGGNDGEDGILVGEFLRDEGDDIVFSCPKCGQHYRISKAKGLDRMYCGNCDRLVSIPLKAKEDELSSGDAVQAMEPEEEIPDGNLVCPHCWKSFDQEHLLYISVHPSLVGDPIVGEFEASRFKPGVFNQLGQPLDACGVPATEMACPCCHLRFPAGMLDSDTLYFSIAGATASGKSYFLTCLTHVLKERLPRSFGISFFDLDPRLNETLSRYEKQLFMPLDPTRITALPATQISGEGVSDSIRLDGVDIELPKPFIFDYQPNGKPEMRRNIVFYDNSGELFTPGRDEWVNQATRHLSHSNGIVFLFDPVNDSLMRRKICNPADPQVSAQPRVVDQTILLTELVSRLRRNCNMNAMDKCDIPLVVAICKYDIWKDCFKKTLDDPVLQEENGISLDLNKVLDVSFALRDLVLAYVPALVNVAESFFKHVTFVPVSALGTLAEQDEQGVIGVVSEKIRPVWVDVPFYLIMHENGLMQGTLKRKEGQSEFNFKARIQEQLLLMKHPVTGEVVRLPLNYCGARLDIGGKFYDLPAEPHRSVKKEQDSFWN